MKPLTLREKREMQRGGHPCRVLRLHRLESMPLEKLATYLGRDKGYVSRLERGEYVGSFAVWRELATLFNVSLDEIAPYIREDRRDRSRSAPS